MYIEQKQDKVLRPQSVYTKSAQEDNQITTELLNLITEAGLTPSADDLTQVKTAVLAIASGGNDKADTDLSNLTSAGDIYGSKLSMPSTTSLDMALAASGTTYTATSTGWIYISGTQYSDNGYVFLENVSASLTMVCQPPRVNSFEIRAFIPVIKGQTFRVTYANCYIYVFKLIYAEGSKTEAN